MGTIQNVENWKKILKRNLDRLKFYANKIKSNVKLKFCEMSNMVDKNMSQNEYDSFIKESLENPWSYLDAIFKNNRSTKNKLKEGIIYYCDTYRKPKNYNVGINVGIFLLFDCIIHNENSYIFNSSGETDFIRAHIHDNHEKYNKFFDYLQEKQNEIKFISKEGVIANNFRNFRDLNRKLAEEDNNRFRERAKSFFEVYNSYIKNKRYNTPSNEQNAHPANEQNAPPDYSTPKNVEPSCIAFDKEKITALTKFIDEIKSEEAALKLLDDEKNQYTEQKDSLLEQVKALLMDIDKTKSKISNTKDKIDKNKNIYEEKYKNLNPSNFNFEEFLTVLIPDEHVEIFDKTASNNLLKEIIDICETIKQIVEDYQSFIGLESDKKNIYQKLVKDIEWIEQPELFQNKCCNNFDEPIKIYQQIITFINFYIKNILYKIANKDFIDKMNDYIKLKPETGNVYKEILEKTLNLFDKLGTKLDGIKEDNSINLEKWPLEKLYIYKSEKIPALYNEYEFTCTRIYIPPCEFKSFDTTDKKPIIINPVISVDITEKINIPDEGNTNVEELPERESNE